MVNKGINERKYTYLTKNDNLMEILDASRLNLTTYNVLDLGYARFNTRLAPVRNLPSCTRFLAESLDSPTNSRVQGTRQFL